MILVSIAVLSGFTLIQAERQRKVMLFEIETENHQIEQLVHVREFDHVGATALQLSIRNFQNKTGGDINAVAMVYDKNAELAATETAGNNKNRLERLQMHLGEATKNEDELWRYMAWSGTNSIIKIEYYETYRRNSDGTYSDGSGSTLWPADDDKAIKSFHVFVAEAFPLSIALRQLLPAYFLVALLLTALIITHKKRNFLIHQKEEVNRDNEQ
jgi:hypothetical protein